MFHILRKIGRNIIDVPGHVTKMDTTSIPCKIYNLSSTGRQIKNFQASHQAGKSAIQDMTMSQKEDISLSTL